MNGWAFRRVQQGRPAFADIPVVILSALPQTATTAAQLGVARYLHKPFTADQLLALLERVCT
jgi:CheY-like chemotaxis protein